MAQPDLSALVDRSCRHAAIVAKAIRRAAPPTVQSVAFTVQRILCFDRN